jgi:hypothetical protein
MVINIGLAELDRAEIRSLATQLADIIDAVQNRLAAHGSDSASLSVGNLLHLGRTATLCCVEQRSATPGKHRSTLRKGVTC